MKKEVGNYIIKTLSITLMIGLISGFLGIFFFPFWIITLLSPVIGLLHPLFERLQKEKELEKLKRQRWAEEQLAKHR